MMVRMTSTAAVFGPLFLLLLRSTTAAPTLTTDGLFGPAPLRFGADGTFQITIFNDLHYGEAENTLWGPQQDVNSTAVMEAVLDAEQPQLVVINGDLITGENTFKENSTVYVDQIVAPLVARGLPWASTYGNHDSDFNLSRADIYAREKRYPNSLTQNMAIDLLDPLAPGITNYYLLVYPHDGLALVPELILWFFDSRGGNYYQQADANGDSIGQPDWVDQSVVDWFTLAKAELKLLFGGKTIPSLGFVHIPINAFLAFQQGQDGQGDGVNPSQEPGINADNPLSQQGVASGQGNTGTDFTYQGQDVPFMQALLDTEGLMAVFSGHDHGDDWCFKWDSRLPGMKLTGNGLNLCFGRHSGYGGYSDWTRGSRQVLVDQKNLGVRGAGVESWVRLEDKSISGSVVLNATYGQDSYPTVPYTET